MPLKLQIFQEAKYALVAKLRQINLPHYTCLRVENIFWILLWKQFIQHLLQTFMTKTSFSQLGKTQVPVQPSVQMKIIYITSETLVCRMKTRYFTLNSLPLSFMGNSIDWKTFLPSSDNLPRLFAPYCPKAHQDLLRSSK